MFGLLVNVKRGSAIKRRCLIGKKVIKFIGIIPVESSPIQDFAEKAS